MTLESASPAVVSCGAPFHPAADASKPACASLLHRRKVRGAVALLLGVLAIGAGGAIWEVDRRRSHTDRDPAATVTPSSTDADLPTAGRPA